MRSSQKARSVHDVSEVALDGINERKVFVRIVLEVRILHDDDVGSRLLKSPAEGRSLPGVGRLEDHRDPLEIERPLGLRQEERRRRA